MLKFAPLFGMVAALAAMMSGNSVAQAIVSAKATAVARAKQPKPIVESRTKQVGHVGSYCTERTSVATDRRRAAKRRNVLKNRRAQRRAKN